MSRYTKFTRPAPPFESAPEPRVVSGGAARGARLRGGSSLVTMQEAIEGAQRGKGGRRAPQQGGARRVKGAGRPKLRGGEAPRWQRLHVGFGAKKMKGGSKLLLKGGARSARTRGSMMRGGSMESADTQAMDSMTGATPATQADLGSDGGSGALGVGTNMMQMTHINPRPQHYGGAIIAPMRLMVDRIPINGQ